MLLLPCGAALHAQPNAPYRVGVHVGMATERSSFTWMEASDARTTLDVEAQQNGLLGLTFEFSLSSHMLIEFGPHYGQRNVPIATLQRLGGVNFTLIQDPVDYLGIPAILKYLPFDDGLVLPYAGAGLEFGMNLSSLRVTIEEHRYSDEPPFRTTIVRTRNLNQLYNAVLAEAGLDIRASADWSVLLGVRFTQELSPLLEDELLSWRTPHNWKLRFAVLYTFGDQP
jgi:outer membrane protein W